VSQGIPHLDGSEHIQSTIAFPFIPSDSTPLKALLKEKETLTVSCLQFVVFANY
jgi:hypothetical protein